jgi:drug/metabolite transporter (DMT)-like permease
MTRAWLLLAVIVACTVISDVLTSFEMKRHGEIDDFGPSGLGRTLHSMARKKFLMLAIVFLAVSFFAFILLVQTADLSFAVPASALSFVVETVLARTVLKERVDARRWWGVCLVAFGVGLLAR